MKKLAFNRYTILRPSRSVQWRGGFLAHLAANRIGWNFGRIVPVEEVGTFKPPPFTELTETVKLSIYNY